MSDNSSIEWTDSTWNPVRGCTKVSAGCKNCYAERFAERFRGVKGHPFEQGFDLRLVPEALELPLHWKKPRRIFVNSMSDLFHEAVPEEFIAQVFAVMELCPQHTFQILTKRAARMAEITTRLHRQGRFNPRNVWLGASVEDQRAADERIPHLLATPAAVRFLSCEPLLGPVNLHPWLCENGNAQKPEQRWSEEYCSPRARNPLHWVIAGGESGPGARPCDLAWIRSIVRQCREAAVPCFVKQLGACATDPANGLAGRSLKVPSEAAALVSHRLSDPKGGSPCEWPADLRAQEMPEVVRG